MVLRATDDYFAQQDYFGRWLAECCTLDPTLSAKPFQLLQSFQRWCQQNGEGVVDNSKLRGMIERTPGLRYVTITGTQWVRGVGLKPSGTSPDRVEGG